MAKGLVDWKVDFSSLGELIGTVEGIGDAANDANYMSGLIRKAHEKATREFDITAASVAATGFLSHMYEFGTSGVTPGPAKFDATNPAARLWTHQITGLGRSQDIGFVFRPAVVPNPQPTVASTGVPSKVLRKLSRRRYIFRQRAMVVETGMEVAIKPKSKKVNFVPFYGRPKNPAYRNRTHLFRPFEGNGPMITSPGEESGAVGTFTAFWTRWWATQGRDILYNDITDTFSADVRVALEEAAAKAKANPPTQKVNKTTARRRTKNRMTKASAKRGRTKK